MHPLRQSREKGTDPHSTIELQRQHRNEEEIVDSQEMRTDLGFGNQDETCLTEDGMIKVDIGLWITGKHRDVMNTLNVFHDQVSYFVSGCKA